MINELELLKNNSNVPEQNALTNNTEISGIPLCVNESLNDVIICFGKKLNIEIKNSNLSKLYREKNNKDSQGKIIVHFINKIIKDNLVSGIKTLYKSGKQLTSNHVNSNFPETNIYINDQLSKGNKRLFWLSKLLSKTYDFIYTWTNSSGVFMKKNYSSHSFRVISVNQLIKIDVDKKVIQLYDGVIEH
ncbi:unnamed protein product [Macrosiphum euphorbiae]|uniref:FP protein C-terminal domain-containing protein n=1 Tax=Macrosiphum euphorbiae TaxID=13131 RepID=A0AAV0WI56_9HEMI|nr:unnamed protein product [Macrosiphum euphorbiae]